MVSFFFFFFLIFIYLFIYFLWLCWVFVSVRGLSPVVASGGHSSSRCAGLSPSRPLTIAASRCGAQAPDAQAQQLWLTGPVAPRHVGSSQTRARTRVPCTGRQTLNHSATREAPQWYPSKHWCWHSICHSHCYPCLSKFPVSMTWSEAMAWICGVLENSLLFSIMHCWVNETNGMNSLVRALLH